MANTLTNLIPDAYAALDVVSRELVGFIPSVARDSSVDRLAKGQTVRSYVTPANTAGGNITPSMSPPAAADQTIANQAITISKERFQPFSWIGEEQYAMDTGPGYLNIRQDQIAQSMRALVNEMETDIAVAAALGASRAAGVPSTALFGSSVGDSAQVRKILDDNGAPMSARSLVIDTVAGASLRTLAQLTKANEAGTAMTLRDGELLNLHGFSIKESAQIQRPVAGTAINMVLNGSHAVGATTITIKTGTGNVSAGDVLLINGKRYVAATGRTGVGAFTIAAPGLLDAGVDGNAVVVQALGARNVAFSQNAIILATRLPATVAEGDQALMREVITDPRSGISFEIVAWPGYDMITYHVRAVWGVKVIKPEHVALLID